MKKFILFLLAIAAVVFSASTCEKMEPGDYRDFSGAKINPSGMRGKRSRDGRPAPSHDTAHSTAGCRLWKQRSGLFNYVFSRESPS